MSSSILLKNILLSKCVLVGLLVTKAHNKVIQWYIHMLCKYLSFTIMQQLIACIHPVYHQFIWGHVWCLEKLHHKMFIYYKIKNIIGLMADLLDVEKKPKVGNSPVLTYKNASLFCWNSDSLHIRLVFTLKLPTTCINQCNIRD